MRAAEEEDKPLGMYAEGSHHHHVGIIRTKPLICHVRPIRVRFVACVAMIQEYSGMQTHKMTVVTKIVLAFLEGRERSGDDLTHMQTLAG